MNKIDNILLIKLIDKVDELELKISNLEKMVDKISEMRWYYELLESHKEK